MKRLLKEQPFLIGIVAIVLGLIVWKSAIAGIDSNTQQLAFNEQKRQEAANFNAQGGSITVSYQVQVLDIRPELQVLRWVSFIPIAFGVIVILSALARRPQKV